MQTVNNATTSEKNVANLLDEKTLSTLLEKTKMKKVSESEKSLRENFFKDEKEMRELSAKAQKGLRKRRRDFLFDTLIFNFKIALQQKDAAKLKSASESFLQTYKKVYAKNDFSISSLYQGSDQSQRFEEVKYFLETFKNYLSLTEKK